MSSANSASLNGRCSPVACISTMSPVAGEHEVGVGLGVGILLVVEVEHRRRLRTPRSRWPPPGRGSDCPSAPFVHQVLHVASRSATQAPVIAAVRVPPSAWMTSQSRVICARPAPSGRRPRAASGRSGAGSPGCGPIACPARPRAGRGCGWRAAACRIRPVTQPRPLPRSQPGTPCSTLAVHQHLGVAEVGQAGAFGVARKPPFPGRFHAIDRALGRRDASSAFRLNALLMAHRRRNVHSRLRVGARSLPIR